MRKPSRAQAARARRHGKRNATPGGGDLSVEKRIIIRDGLGRTLRCTTLEGAAKIPLTASLAKYQLEEDGDWVDGEEIREASPA